MRRLALQLMGRDLVSLDFGEVVYATVDDEPDEDPGRDHMGASIQYGFTMPTIATPEERWEG